MSEPLPHGLPDGLRRVLVRDMVLVARIGVHRHEQERHQRVRVNIDLLVRDEPAEDDRIASVVSYETVVVGVRAVIAAGHVHLVETLAERIASLCLGDPRALSATVRVEKLDIFPDVDAVGVEITRRQGQA